MSPVSNTGPVAKKELNKISLKKMKVYVMSALKKVLGSMVLWINGNIYIKIM